MFLNHQCCANVAVDKSERSETWTVGNRPAWNLNFVINCRSPDSASWTKHRLRPFQEVGREEINLTGPTLARFWFMQWNMFGIVKLKHSVLWKSLLFMLLMRRDKLFHGNCSSNVKADSLSSTQMETLLLALREWIVKVTAWSESHQMLGTVLLLHRRRLAAKQTVLVAHYRSFPQEEHQLRVTSIVCGIIRRSGPPELEQLSPSLWLWRDGHSSPSACTRLNCSFTHYLN